MTYRERRLAKAERLRGWADKRVATATAALATGDKYRGDIAFNTQPGHIPERARLIAREHRAFESLDKAEGMVSRADSIEVAADHAIYSDDEDAVERLRERIANLEAKRTLYKAANEVYRKAHRAELAAMTFYQRSQVLPFPSYSLTNLSGNISRQKARLASLEHPAPTWFHASRRDPDLCYKCDSGFADHTPHSQVPSILMCPTSDGAR